jgi:outer membrane lipoprotein-sorting protein
MRYVPLALLVPALAIAGGRGNEAEKLFRDLEKRVAAAKTIRVSFVSTVYEGEKDVGQLKGSITLEEGEKGSVKAKGKLKEMELALDLVSDGKKLTVVSTAGGKAKEQPLPKKFGASARLGLSRVGPTAGLFMVGAAPDPGKEDQGLDLEKLLQLSDFKAGGTARVEGREARVLEYHVTLGGEKLAMKLWLDAKTGLPLKRELRGPMAAQSMRVVETYSEFKLGAGDAKGPAKTPGSSK